MPVYEYKGIDAKGKNITGIIDAESEKAGRLKLRRSGVYTTSIYLEGTKRGLSFSTSLRQFSLFQRVKTVDLAHMTRQLATLLAANIPLVDALAALQDQLENLILKKAVSQIKDKVVEGGRLADAMRAFPNIFGNLYISMVKAGEASGALEQVLLRLADFTEYQAVLKSKITSALFYPIIMATLGVGLVTYLLLSAVPKIITIFEDAEMILPLPTRILISVSGFLQSYWWLLLIIVFISVWFIRRYIRTPAGRLRVDRLSLKMPVFGALFRKVAISRFSRTLGTLLRSGVQLLEALEIVKNVVNNRLLAQAIDETKVSVKEGESLADPLKKSGEFPPMMIHMIAIGEKTGVLEGMLEKVGDNYDQEVDATVGRLTTILEPLMIIMMGGVVAFIVLSILLPILKMSQMA